MRFSIRSSCRAHSVNRSRRQGRSVIKGDQCLDSVGRCHVHRRLLTGCRSRDDDALGMFDGMPQCHWIAPVTSADGHVDGIIVTVVLEIGEGDLFSFVFVTKIKRKHLDGDAIALVLLGQGLQRFVPAGWRDLFAVLCHG